MGAQNGPSQGGPQVCNNVELLGETLDERIQRLAVKDAERREQLRQDLEELHHKDRAKVPLMPWPSWRCHGQKWAVGKVSSKKSMDMLVFCFKSCWVKQCQRSRQLWEVWSMICFGTAIPSQIIPNHPKSGFDPWFGHWELQNH